MGRWRGLDALVHDAVEATTDLVEEGHRSAARSTVRVLSQFGLGGPVRAIDAVRERTTAGILGTIRTVNRGVESVVGGALDTIGPALPAEPSVGLRSDVLGTAPWIGDALLGAVNGAVGDHLHRRGNGLALGMSLRVPPSPDRSRLAVFVHGLGTTEWSWSLDAERFLGDPETTFATLLQRDLGFAPVFVRYNTGRRVSENGRLLADQLEALVAESPVEEIVLVGHSMGGLVARAAGTIAAAEGHQWLARLTRVLCLGSPHEGAGLERFAHLAAGVLGAIDLPGTRIPAAVIRGRSVGIKDLGHGDVTDGDWVGRDPDAVRVGERPPVETTLLPGVSYAFVAGTVTVDPDHPLSRMVGDLLVRVASATPVAPRGGTFVIHTARFGGIRHYHLQVHPDVYAQIRRFLETTAAPG